MEDKYSFEDKFGQMLMVGLDVTCIDDDVVKLIQDYKIGGVILYKKNYNSYHEMLEFINRLKEINRGNIPLFIAIDQENGIVNRFPSDIHPLKGARKQALTESIQVINEVNEITCEVLSSVGVNMNLAPVMDIDYNDIPLLKYRSYGNNKSDVIKYAFPMIKSLQNNGIIPVLKHFPGHGLVKKDSHFYLPKIRDIEKMKSEDFSLYLAAINQGIDAIMVGHLKVKSYGTKPASINREFIMQELRQELKFDGLVITDDIMMSYMKYLYGIKRMVIRAINSSVDIVMIKYYKGDLNKIYKKLFKLLKIGVINHDNVNASFERIMKVKLKYNLSNDLLEDKINLKEINKRIDDVNKMI